MEISRNAWHVRINQHLIDVLGSNTRTLARRNAWRYSGVSESEVVRSLPLSIYTPSNLCTHFWQTVGTLWILPPVKVAQLSWRYVLRFPAALVAAIGIGIFGGAAWGWDHRPRRTKPEPKAKEPSLVWEYLKAKKRRVCPLITVKD